MLFVCNGVDNRKFLTSSDEIQPKGSISNKTLHSNVAAYEISYSGRGMRVHEFEVS